MSSRRLDLSAPHLIVATVTPFILKLPLQMHGILASTVGALLPGARFERAFENLISAFMQEHLQPEPAVRPV